MPSLQDIHDIQNRSIDAAVSAFEQHLKQIVSRAETRVIATLQAKLKTDAGVVVRTPANSRLLRRFDVLFSDALEKEGYQRLVNAFVNQFAGQLPYFQETLAAISETLREPLGTVTFTANDKASFSAFQQNVAAAIQSAVEGAAGRATQQALFSIGGLKFGDLVSLLKDKLDVSVAQASGLAETGISGFIRSVNMRGYDIIAEQNPSFTFRFKYFGPKDSRNRPFCAEQETLSKQGVTRTKEEWDALDNGKGQPKPVSIWLGGFRCRHVLLLVPPVSR